jgi:type IV fimbrial biogenesis protein FimT
MLRSTSRKRRFLSQEEGFTLIEIAIVTAIIGIAAALAAPNLTAMYARHELFQTTTELYNRFVFARSAAISRNAMVVATPTSLAGGQWQMLFNVPQVGGQILPLTVQLVEPLPAAPVVPLPSPGQPIGFTPRGLSTTPLAVRTIRLQSTRVPNLIYTISLAPSGKVTWCTRDIVPCVVSG